LGRRRGDMRSSLGSLDSPRPDVSSQSRVFFGVSDASGNGVDNEVALENAAQRREPSSALELASRLRERDGKGAIRKWAL
jgi:hypothetical protein